jgi:CheY-like chemotaxis protein
VLNLLTNAVKFTPPGGAIEVSLTQNQNRSEIRVKDTGMGVKPEFMPYVFERFRQADPSTSRRHGLGLGLAIVKQLVELHGGNVAVESAGENKGAVFSISLPPGPPSEVRAESPAITPKPSRLRSSIPDLSGCRVLVVDDEPDARTLLTRILSETKAEIFAAASAEEALRLLTEKAPSIIISDIGMPKVDGYEMIKKIRTRSAATGGKTPAIALTAFARPEDRAKALAAGFQQHLTKPIEWGVLLSAIAQLTRGH